MEKKFEKCTFQSDEKSRLKNLERYKILYTKSEPIFDQLTAITATMLNAPIALINFVDRDNVWVKISQNTESLYDYQEETTLCTLAVINESAAIFENAIKEPHLMSNPLIAGEFGLQFYAAAPIITDEGFNVGTVCIVDKKVRKFLPKEQRKLEWVACMVKKEMNKRVAEKACA